MRKSLQSMLKNSYFVMGGAAVVGGIVSIICAVIMMTSGSTDAAVPLLIVSVLAAGTGIFGFLTALASLNSKIAEPMKQLSEAAKKMGNSDYSVNLKMNTGLEFDDMAAAFNSVAASNKVQADFISSIADGDFTRSITVNSENDAVAKSLLDLSVNINKAFSDISSGAMRINDGGAQVSSASMTLSQGATEQASTIEELSASINEIRGEVVKNAENAKEAYKNAEFTSGEVKNGTEKMHELLKAMDDISRSTGEIERFIKVIEDIAFQTNILALNSSVEAARAGEAGKGFSVVASEVKNLATKSQEAAQHTNKLIQSCVQSVREGVEKTRETASTFATIAEKTEEISNGLNIISAACERQSESITQINVGVEQISSVVQNTSATAEQCAASASDLTGRSETLKQIIGRFRFKDAAGKASSSYAPVKEAAPVSAPVHKPAPKPASAAKYEPAPKPASAAKYEPAPKPASAAKYEPAPKPASAAKYEPVPKPASAAKHEPAPKPASAAKSTSAIKTASAAKPAAKPASSAPAIMSQPKGSYANAEFVDVPDNKY